MGSLTCCTCRHFLRPVALAWQTAREHHRCWTHSARKRWTISALWVRISKKNNKHALNHPIVDPYLNLQRNIQKGIKWIRDCFAVWTLHWKKLQQCSQFTVTSHKQKRHWTWEDRHTTEIYTFDSPLDLRYPPNTWWMKVVVCVCLSDLAKRQYIFYHIIKIEIVV